MKLNKIVTSRSGRQYDVSLNLERNEIINYIVTNLKGDLLWKGSGAIVMADNKDANYLVKATENIILFMEECYSDIDHVRSFEDWDGIIK